MTNNYDNDNSTTSNTNHDHITTTTTNNNNDNNNNNNNNDNNTYTTNDNDSNLKTIRPFVIRIIVRPRIFESEFRHHCAKKLDGALRKPPPLFKN